jgi:DNA adenine methylase
MIKTPISYYGGKQRLAPIIVRNIPDHDVYTEAFAGGAAVFWAKPPSRLECINDQSGHVIAFYRALKAHFPILRKLITETVSSRAIHRKAAFILKYSDHHNIIDVAWAFWVQTNMSFTSKLFGGYAYDRSKGSCVKTLYNKRVAFTKHLAKRLEMVDIESNDAVKVIESRDSDRTFHYVDPPYFNSDCGHYSGYTENDFKTLLKALQNAKGKFLLSSYDSNILQEYVTRNEWYQERIVQKISASKTRTGKEKTEVLTANYPISLN